MQQYARTQNAPEPPTTKIRLDAFQKAGKVVSLKPNVPEASAAFKISIGNFGV